MDGARAWLGEIDPRIWQAVIAGLFLAMGWIVNGWQNRRAAARAKAERLRDLHRAIFAEIETNLANLWDVDALNAYGAEMRARMEADETFVPFIPRERHDRLFDTIVADLSVLPRVTIDPIVKYYAQVGSIAAIAEDMRGEGFRALPQARRIPMYEDYIQMKVQALEYGRVANHLIRVFAADGKAAAEAEATRLSSPSAGRSVP
ncbi:hypothetical protein [Wenxinia marina]|uniref:Uncharacterized protein n=1 Tax=Wenxinia marina DSM 24838 TaxID=1123501 RepID=A0A0D0QCM2_9RHOB|nr:hypothetical protein [Wenxinia marina]KIQ68678.1 hypothetical protein Wenmar_02949 [Wenxinia marina DSM 24838]GGL67856.1 hypothetical protein GCM10011392_22920 [Wenxinia marina]